MYISQILLNPQNRRVQREIVEPYQMHRTIMSAFPATLSEDERVLFRLDTNPRSGSFNLLVQSEGSPDWSHLNLSDAPGFLLNTTEPNPCIKLFNPNFHSGQHLTFRLRANPTVKRNGKRLGLYREQEQWEWLKRKAQVSGFQVIGARISQQDQIRGPIHREDGRHELRLLAVQFDGLLLVIDPTRFLESIQTGIGSGKGLGCGLISLAPVQ